MRRLGFLTGHLLLVGAAGGAATVPSLFSRPFAIALAGVVCWLVALGGRLLIGATAGSWKRLRTGTVGAVCGLVGLLLYTLSGHWFGTLWCTALMAAGIILTLWFRFKPAGSAGEHRVPGPVQSPLFRRQVP